MHFSKIAALLASAASVAMAGNQMTFHSLDSTDRTVHCTPTAGKRWPAPFNVDCGAKVTVDFDDGWIGNCYAVPKGAPAVPGMLAEVTFQGWLGKTYYDVSAIVNPNDVDNVSEMFPTEHPGTPISGCGPNSGPFPCNNCYYHPDDVQTKSTDQTHLYVTLGKNGGVQSRDTPDSSPNVKRDFVLGKY